MSFWSFKPKEIPLQDTFERLAIQALEYELDQWDFLDKNLVKTNEWRINLHTLFHFQHNLFGLQNTEFRRVIGDLIAEHASRLGLIVTRKTLDELILEF